MNSEYYLPAPAFGLAWYESSTSPLAYILMPGGGGSSKTGVKNQVMLASLNPEAKQQAQVQLLSGFLTDTEDRSNFCSGISYGTILVSTLPPHCLPRALALIVCRIRLWYVP